MSHPGFDSIEENLGPPHPENIQSALRRSMAMLNRLNQGKANVVLDVTLTPNSATTVITDVRLSLFGAAIFDPLTANAAAELRAAGGLHVLEANRMHGTWTLTHINNAQTDRSYRMIHLG